MKIRDFKPGDTVYLLRRPWPYKNNSTPIINKGKVLRVGHKYLTINDSWQTQYRASEENYCIENTGDYLSETFLFANKKDLEEYMERQELIRWLLKLSSSKFEKLSLEQLREIKKILEK